MLVLILEKTPRSLRGALSRWLLEPKTGVFVGNPNPRIREKLWERVMTGLGEGSAMMIFSSRCAQGYEVLMAGEANRELADFDGLTLIRRPVAK